jgi:hypothetical protein
MHAANQLIVVNEQNKYDLLAANQWANLNGINSILIGGSTTTPIIFM